MDMITTITMTSREIAELTGKRHTHVLADIRTMLDDLGFDSAEFSAQYKDSTGRTLPSFNLPKRETLILVSGYSVELRAKIIDRWQELEQQVAKPQFKIPETLGDALQLAADLAKKVEQDKPKVEHFDRVVDLDRTMNITMAATKLGRSARSVNQVLDTLGVYNKSIVRSRVFNQWFVDAGYGVVRQTSNGFTQSLLTIKGEIWLGQQLSDLGLIPKNVKPLEIEHV